MTRLILGLISFLLAAIFWLIGIILVKPTVRKNDTP